MTVNLSALPSMIQGWFKQGIAIALLVFLALTVLKLFGFSPYPIATFDAQATGALVAGIAFALSKL